MKTTFRLKAVIVQDGPETKQILYFLKSTENSSLLSVR